MPVAGCCSARSLRTLAQPPEGSASCASAQDASARECAKARAPLHLLVACSVVDAELMAPAGKPQMRGGLTF
eukprot:CAMPEP_0171108954 /NCGR_PEP_ID=MMETSP0766_2-20121228/69947_1 /TAXON_ID=439317 /ORGANISM="Gambierdiscus australes, Strain CAWD 149" /LENGTH=71 /DNA_ID=CAMNT_0011570581 /DNA_START=184 /DNA_END=399 /DNA_ORIENTATION=-